MVTIIRQSGLSFRIYKADHPPAHVHVIGDGEARFLLKGTNGDPELDGVFGMSSGDVRKAIRIVRAQQYVLLQSWKELHGGTD